MALKPTPLACRFIREPLNSRRLDGGTASHLLVTALGKKANLAPQAATAPGARTSESAAGGSRSKGACLPNGSQAQAGTEVAKLKNRAELGVLAAWCGHGVPRAEDAWACGAAWRDSFLHRVQVPHHKGSNARGAPNNPKFSAVPQRPSAARRQGKSLALFLG
jgi:hypothetical protein